MGTLSAFFIKSPDKAKDIYKLLRQQVRESVASDVFKELTLLQQRPSFDAAQGKVEKLLHLLKTLNEYEKEIQADLRQDTNVRESRNDFNH